ncbi:hypothetical protein PAAG_12324 [Paracoccidioides lutzii Pb01]|uniref:Uncharacterized protein n=1 Tax=Paracoccidioides lutzii (strain ATCC MYA-826 / Pb01) TaxID=502779 RepID=A0A0A2V3Q7_PARBA|nr:hypothetical protein PAAG_12324 [Paracoccidioides lutzii Pb01]KGQ01012.1 hypothetical protein PAAG_12324 [Paracoccidioides lutzii Pb01]
MSLNKVWDSAGGTPFYPLVSKDSHFFVALTLLLTNRSFVSVPLFGVPASLAFGYAPLTLLLM